jgi:hypothetical protein
MVVYNTQNYRDFGLCSVSGILKTLENTVFQKLNLFLSLDKEGLLLCWVHKNDLILLDNLCLVIEVRTF